MFYLLFSVFVSFDMSFLRILTCVANVFEILSPHNTNTREQIVVSGHKPGIGLQLFCAHKTITWNVRISYNLSAKSVVLLDVGFKMITCETTS